MPRDFTKTYRLDQLSTDAAELRRIAGAIATIIDDMRLTARLMQDSATGDALTATAQELADAMHGAWATVAVAHDAACDEEGKEPMYVIDADDARAFGMKPARVAAKVLS